MSGIPNGNLYFNNNGGNAGKNSVQIFDNGNKLLSWNGQGNYDTSWDVDSAHTVQNEIKFGDSTGSLIIYLPGHTNALNGGMRRFWFNGNPETALQMAVGPNDTIYSYSGGTPAVLPQGHINLFTAGGGASGDPFVTPILV